MALHTAPSERRACKFLPRATAPTQINLTNTPYRHRVQVLRQGNSVSTWVTEDRARQFHQENPSSELPDSVMLREGFPFCILAVSPIRHNLGGYRISLSVQFLCHSSLRSESNVPVTPKSPFKQLFPEPKPIITVQTTSPFSSAPPRPDGNACTFARSRRGTDRFCQEPDQLC